MKTIKIMDCDKEEQNLNVSFIYNVRPYNPGHGQPIFTEILLHCTDKEKPFAIYKTDESVSSLLLRLEEYN